MPPKEGPAVLVAVTLLLIDLLVSAFSRTSPMSDPDHLVLINFKFANFSFAVQLSKPEVSNSVA